MQSLEAAACQQAQHLIQQQTKSKASKVNSASYNDKSDIQFISINEKLKDLYEEECAKDYSKPYKPTRSPSRLLSKLVVREGLSTLLVKLYPGDRGYTVALGGCGGGSKKGASTSSGGTAGVVLPYEQDELLQCIDREELPAGIGDLLEKATTPIFYGGCVVAEVHDMRHCPAGHTRFVLLRPSNQSLLCDINMITRDGDWSPEERTALESQLLQATQGPLCLDPSPTVSIAAIRARQQGLQLDSAPLRRVARKFSQVSVNKKRKLDQYASQCTTPLLDFINQRKLKTRNVPSTKSKSSILEAPPLETMSAPDVSDVARLARAFEPLRHTADCTPQLVEEYTLETERSQGRIYHIRLSVLQRHSSTEFLGELYVDRDYKEGIKNGSSCRFALGTRAHAIRYIHQFTQIFTEEGRKSVRITKLVPGEPSRVTYTGNWRERENAKAAAAAASVQGSYATAPQVPQLVATAITNGIQTPPHQHNNIAAAVQPQHPNATMMAPQQSPTPVMQTSPVPLPPSPIKSVSPTRHHNTDPGYNAFVASLISSAQQFQQTAAMNNSTMVSNSTMVNSKLNTPLLQQQQKQAVRKIASNNLLSSRLNAPIQTVPIAPHTTTPILSPSLVPPAQLLSALTSQLNAPPVIAPAQPCFSLPTTNNSFSYSLPNKVMNHAGRLPDASNGARRQSNNNIAEQLSSNMGHTMPGLSALLAGTPSADNPIPGTNSNSTLLERLTAPQYIATTGMPVPVSSPSPKPITPSPMSSPSHQTSTLNLSSLNLNVASLQGHIASMPGLQNVQVTIPPLFPSPIALSLNVSTPVTGQQTGVIVTTLPLGSTNTTTCPSGINSVVSSLNPSPTHTQNHTMLLAGSNLNASPTQTQNHTMLLTGSNLNPSPTQTQNHAMLLTGSNLNPTQTQNHAMLLAGSSLNPSPTQTQNHTMLLTGSNLNSSPNQTQNHGMLLSGSNLNTNPTQSQNHAMLLAGSNLNQSPTQTPNHAMLLAGPNTGQMLSLPVAQVVTSGMKNTLNQPQGIRTPNSVVIPQLGPGSHQQSIQLLGTLRGAPTGMPQTRGQRPIAASQKLSPGPTPQALTAQQQLQLALQKHPQLQQCLSQQQKSAATINSKHRRRSSTAEPK